MRAPARTFEDLLVLRSVATTQSSSGLAAGLIHVFRKRIEVEWVKIFWPRCIGTLECDS